MNDSTFTPGPWKSINEPEESLIAIVRPWGNGVTPGNEPTFGSGLGAHIAEIQYTQTGIPTFSRAEANARLIAAAPELLAACELWDQGFTDGEEFTADQFLAWVNRNRAAARAAIAKAKGGAS